MHQYTLPMPLPERLSVHDFTVSDANRIAHAWVMRWPDWPKPVFLLTGPEGSGKTHLSRIWQEKSGADVIEAKEFSNFSVERMAPSGLVVEHIEQAASEEALFHLLNHALNTPMPLMLTAGVPRDALPFQLADVRSRLSMLPQAELSPPDDALLEKLLRKRFADRQLDVGDEVIGYLLPRIERSFAAVHAVVEELDAAALSEGRRVSVRLAGESFRHKA